MYRLRGILLSCLLVSVFFACAHSASKEKDEKQHSENTLTLQPDTTLQNGADQTGLLIPLLEGKRVALIVNQTSVTGNKGVHLLDTLLSEGVNIKKVFAPEHGFRGDADAGEVIAHGKDSQTGIPIISLYGKNKKPSAEQLSDIDVVVFDIQDVGARFYTYISTMAYAMEACAEQEKEFIVLDRPNPCDYVDGPVLQKSYKSFVGMFPIPILHGCTVGELAEMIKGEEWIGQAGKLKLSVIKVRNWKHGQAYSLPVKPSPNLPNDQSVALYPSLCLFEATNISVGRGTVFPFQVLGAPDKTYGSFLFTPRSLPGFDKNPLHKGVTCYGLDLRKVSSPKGLTLEYLIDFYQLSGKGSKFFGNPRWFDQLAGSDKLRKAIISGQTEETIKAGWQDELNTYKNIRNKYLLY